LIQVAHMLNDTRHHTVAKNHNSTQNRPIFNKLGTSITR
jgi:hypothetical protein